jgi:hypothetical protein
VLPTGGLLDNFNWRNNGTNIPAKNRSVPLTPLTMDRPTDVSYRVARRWQPCHGHSGILILVTYRMALVAGGIMLVTPCSWRTETIDLMQASRTCSADHKYFLQNELGIDFYLEIFRLPSIFYLGTRIYTSCMLLDLYCTLFPKSFRFSTRLNTQHLFRSFAGIFSKIKGSFFYQIGITSTVKKSRNKLRIFWRSA